MIYISFPQQHGAGKHNAALAPPLGICKEDTAHSSRAPWLPTAQSNADEGIPAGLQPTLAPVQRQQDQTRLLRVFSSQVLALPLKPGINKASLDSVLQSLAVLTKVSSPDPHSLNLSHPLRFGATCSSMGAAWGAFPSEGVKAPHSRAAACWGGQQQSAG